ncbi:uncharacterized protein LOC124258191 [Haliotis rubra]|uniref:uncharacterized protein LOC124258191 n=1 Tax=Haliotis rubra TaxID=36100 RepID=UPI001EE614D7|nr:uncharacterized protein LOC124258191 [Haliotis rubra]XP_046548204.1 uncharacterized protein LOC124258191 [Haliotis rubra]
MESSLGVKELIDWAVKRVVGGEFTHGDCWVLRTLLKLHIRQSALTANHDKQQEEVVRHICSRTIDALTQGCYIMQAFYFFYETVALVTAAVSEGSISGQDMANQCAITLWMTFFNDISECQKDEKETIDLLKHLRYLAIEHCENNPGFCYCLCQDLTHAFNMMAYSFTEDQNSRIKAYLLVLMARCSFQAKQYRLCTKLCEQACELEEYKSYIPLEVWANALDKEKQYGAALGKLEHALKCVMVISNAV